MRAINRAKRNGCDCCGVWEQEDSLSIDTAEDQIVNLHNTHITGSVSQQEVKGDEFAAGWSEQWRLSDNLEQMNGVLLARAQPAILVRRKVYLAQSHIRGIQRNHRLWNAQTGQ